MKKPFHLRPLSLAFSMALLLCCISAQSLSAATLTDFGFQSRTVNGKLSTNSRPLLIIIANFEGGVTENLRPASYFENRFYFSTQTVNGFFVENSNDRFRWTRAGFSGVIGPIEFTENERLAKLGEARYYSNIIARVIGDDSFDFKPYDRSPTNGVVNSDELQMVFVTNESVADGGARGTSCVSSNVPNGNVRVCVDGNALLFINHQSSFSTIAHEMTHILNVPEDLYNQECLNGLVTIMSCSAGADDTRTWHLDPWNKMRLGWSAPRIMNMKVGGLLTLPAAHRKIVDAPVILYDSTLGVTKFFMLEYRMQTNYDREVVDNGMIVWHVMQDANKNPLQIPSAGAVYDVEAGWRICPKCACFVKNTADSNRCPADNNAHDLSSSPFFLETVDNATVVGQTQWRRCHKCQALYYGPNQSFSNCPADGQSHAPPAFQNHNYSVRTNDIRGTLADCWRCSKCQGIYNAETEAKSSFKSTKTCPAGSNHNAVTNLQYAVVAYDFAMFAMWPNNLSREPGSFLWYSNAITPHLAWADGTTTATRIRVHPFLPDDQEITVEVLTESDTWVDFNYTGFLQNGDFLSPYKTAGLGVTNAPWGGNVKFKPGSRTESAVIDKRLLLQAPLGPGSAVIGQ